MTRDLVRYQDAGHLHFVTFSCYGRRPCLGAPDARHLFEVAVETMRMRYQFLIVGYVVMPEHIHLLVSEPKRADLATAVQAIKLSVTVKRKQRPFWQARYYGFNVFTDSKRIEKLRYIHRNPVTRGLVAKPEDWEWSSFRHYQSGSTGTVSIGVMD